MTNSPVNEAEPVAAIVSAEQVAKPKAFEALPVAVLIKVLENKATALLGMANATQIIEEREGLRFQAYAIRQAATLLAGRKTETDEIIWALNANPNPDA
jgi:hypothetical protein